MVASRATDESVLHPAPASAALERSAHVSLTSDTSLVRDVRWIASASFAYLIAVIAAVLALNPYFSQTWDAVTFVNAGRALTTPAWAGLYELSRAERFWPYAYPPLHALVTAPFVALGAGFPDWLLVRVPPIIADIGVALLVYLIVANRTGEKKWGRLAFAVWLFNPVTFYDTAVQGHFEAEWLFFVVLAYWLAETRRGILFPSLALAAAFLFKQTAILFAIPYWFWLLKPGPERDLRSRLLKTAGSLALFAVPVILISLPFLLYSNDYFYMNVQYVADVPLQTQSWLVALSGVFGENFFLLNWSGALVFAAALLLSGFAIRRGASLWLTAVLICLVFFLLSKKVVGYYYAMLIPFALVELIPARRFGLLALMVVATAWIALSPYFASWADPAHWWVYALFGILNSILWLVLLVRLLFGAQSGTGEFGTSPSAARTLAFVSCDLFFISVGAALVQPFVNNPSSPIRAPLIPAGLESNATLAFLALCALVAAALAVANWLSRTIAPDGKIPRAAFALVLLFVPLYFLTFTLTKESTAVVELVLRSWGV